MAFRMNRRPMRTVLFKQRFVLLLALAGAITAAQNSTSLPHIEGTSLAGMQVVLPDAAHGKTAVLIFGFSKASKDASSAWAQKLYGDFGGRADFAAYQLPVLEGAPSLIRGMIVSSMKKGVPENQRAFFVPLAKGEAELKKLVSFKESDDAYLVTLDASGQIVHQRHGPFRDADYAALRAELQAMLNGK